MNDFIDSTTLQNSQNGNLTHYFREMSSNLFILTADAYFVITPNTRQYYLDNNMDIWEVHKEVIGYLDTQLNVDFAKYDNWKRNGTENYEPGVDGRVDMVFVIWRNVTLELSDPDLFFSAFKFWGGAQASLGGSNGSIDVDNGDRTIYTGWAGSGINKGPGTVTVLSRTGTQHDAAWNKPYGPYRAQIHELAHHWFGIILITMVQDFGLC